MSSKCPKNWYPLTDLDNWYRRVCGQYEARRVPMIDCYASEALYTPDDGPVVSLGVFSSMPLAMAECRQHLDSKQSAEGAEEVR